MGETGKSGSRLRYQSTLDGPRLGQVVDDGILGFKRYSIYSKSFKGLGIQGYRPEDLNGRIGPLIPRSEKSEDEVNTGLVQTFTTGSRLVRFDSHIQIFTHHAHKPHGAL